jgi:energy-coupling factor transporter ATP-binding protein EcfA2
MPRSYLIEGIFPSNEISFIFGSPGSGKSTFICHIATALIDNKPFEFGGRAFNTSQTVIGYAAFDRSTEAIGDLLARYGLADRIQWHSYRNVDLPDGSDQRKVQDIPKDFPNCSTIILDGLGLTIPTGKSNDYCTVGNYIRYCGTVAERSKRNFLATLHAPKPRLREGISNPRMGALGSTAFPGIAEAMVQVEHVNLKDPKDPSRIIRIMPHDGPALESYWTFDEKGMLTELGEQPTELDDNKNCLMFFNVLPAKFETNKSKIIADGLGIPQRTMFRYLKELANAGKLIVVARGVYEKLVSRIA